MPLDKNYVLMPHQVALKEWILERMTGETNFSDTRYYAFVCHLMRHGKTLAVCEMLKEYILEWTHADNNNKFELRVLCPARVIHVWEEHADAVFDQEFYAKANIKFISHDNIENDADKVHKDVIVIDEIHQFRSVQKESQRYALLDSYSKECYHRIGMTGTPYDQFMAELFRPLQWMSHGSFFGEGITKQDFETTYCEAINPRSKYPSFEIKPHLKKEIWEELMKISHVYKSDDIVLPKLSTVKYDLYPKQLRLIRRIRGKKIIPEIADIQSKFSVPVRNGKMRQLYGGFIYHTRNQEVLNMCATRKWLALTQLLEQLEFNKVMIFYQYLEEVNRILDALKPYSAYGIRWAELTDKTLPRFNDDELDILIGHPKSCGVGIDISAANYAIFVSHTASFIDSYQAFFRLSKKGEDMDDKEIFHLLADHYLAKEDYAKMWEKKKLTDEFYEKGLAVYEGRQIFAGD